jgi:hypothetical protein
MVDRLDSMYVNLLFPVSCFDSMYVDLLVMCFDSMYVNLLVMYIDLSMYAIIYVLEFYFKVLLNMLEYVLLLLPEVYFLVLFSPWIPRISIFS